MYSLPPVCFQSSDIIQTYCLFRSVGIIVDVMKRALLYCKVYNRRYLLALRAGLSEAVCDEGWTDVWCAGA